MVIAVRTESGPGGLTVVKTAETDAGRLRLANEAALLRRAAHPGVVEVIDHTPDELRLRHAGTTLTHLLPLAADHAAAVVCAVAEVVDAIHGAGVSHGNLIADHVILDERGRPRLCGFGDATAIDDRRDDAATADIGDLGALFDRLLDEAAHLPWTPTNAGARHRTRRKHARELFRNVAGMAQRADPRQRIAPHQMANAIREALPTLALPTPPPRATDEDGLPIAGVSEIPDDVDATGDVGWSSPELEYLSAREDNGDEGDGHETAAPEDETAQVGDTGAPSPLGPTDRVGPPEAVEPVAPLDPTAPEAPVQGPAIPTEPPPRAEQSVDDTSSDADATDSDDEDDSALGAAPEVEGDDTADTESDIDADTEAPDDATDDDDDEVESDADAAARLERALSSGPPPITIRDGPDDVSRRRRGRADEDAPPKRRIAMVAGGLLIAGVIIGPLVAILIQAFGDDDADDDDSAIQVNTSNTTLPESPSTWPDDCDLPELTGPDADDDGCPEPVTVNGRNVQVGDVPIAFGETGDLVAVGDTDCDGIVTPYLLRPSTGQIFAWAEWPLAEAVDVRSTAEVPGATGIERRDGSTCDVIVALVGSNETVVAGTP